MPFLPRSLHRPKPRGHRCLAALALLALLAGSACGQPTSSAAPSDTAAGPPGPGFVQRNGTRLVLDGKPFVFTGMNIYNAASASRWCWYPMVADGVLDTSLTAIGTGKEAFRAWFFQYEATTNGRRDWSNFDHTLAVARAHGQKVIPVLIDQFGNCEGWPTRGSGYKDEGWYRSGYRTQPTGRGLPATYREWVREVVSRYRDDPTILAWQLVNEAEDAAGLNGTCSQTATLSLVDFATDMARLVKSVDPHHLLSLGTMGSGQCGTRGAEYQAVYATDGIDLCEYHDYDHPRQAVPGDEWNGLAVRLRQCQALGKPLFVGEVGLRPTDADGTLQGRARLLDAKLRGELAAGVVGVLAWAWRDGPNGGSASADYYVGPHDPALTVLGSY